jgi:hypothetical protein
VIYLDVGVQRIQQYLGRTPDLKGRRGASAWLSHATDGKQVAEWIDGHSWLRAKDVRVNPQAGQADGVVSLCLPPQVDAGEVAWEVFEYLRDRLPAVDLGAVWAEGGSYVEAHRVWKTIPDPTASARCGPPISEFPPLETCGQCRVDPGLKPARIHDNERWLCADCLKRYVDVYRKPGLREESVPVGAELDLLERLGYGHDRVVQHFIDLAALGDEHGNRNHVATVFADGNGIGALFGRVIERGGPKAKEDASRAVAEATRKALHEATAVVLEGSPGGKVPVIPHVVGGDDLLVSVVADRAWQFVTAYQEAFSRLLTTDETLRDFVGVDGEQAGASAGVVFTHHRFPFRRAVELADEAKDAAKQANGGRQSAVMWLDVTAEGEQPPSGRKAWTTRDLREYDEAIRALRGVPAAGRAMLQRLVNADDEMLSLARIREHARRLDRAAIVEPFVDSNGSTTRIADALALARWWR